MPVASNVKSDCISGENKNERMVQMTEKPVDGNVSGSLRAKCSRWPRPCESTDSSGNQGYLQVWAGG